MTLPTSASPPSRQRLDPPPILPIGVVAESGLVAAGGAFGALARAALATFVGPAPAAGMLATQLVNGLGAFALGWLLASLERRGPRPRLRAFLAVGVLGSFTTFSTLVDEGLGLAAHRAPGSALVWLGVSLGVSISVGLAAFVLGERLDRAWVGADRARSGSAP